MTFKCIHVCKKRPEMKETNVVQLGIYVKR